MTITAKIIEDSISEKNRIRLTTLELTYPRFIHSEVMTHRVFSRNASSSRAIPILKMLYRIYADMAMPIHWGANQAGMQANAELTAWRKFIVKSLWIACGYIVMLFSYMMHLAGAHKQIANRVTEPWSHITVVLTATEWQNWFDLRNHADAQPEIRSLARAIFFAMKASAPRDCGNDKKDVWNWHLPYVKGYERLKYGLADLLKMSAARCARTSYLTHDNKAPNVENDIKLHDRLVASKPIHASPTEHQAYPTDGEEFSANFRGWQQYRKNVENTIRWNCNA